MYVLAVVGKGGTAKTTTVGTLGELLAARGRRVLVVDLDRQLSLSDWLAPQQIDEAGDPVPRLGVEHVLLGRCGVEDAVVAVTGGLDLLPADEGLIEAEHTIESRPLGRERVLADLMAGWAARWDVVLLDAPRAINALFVNSVWAADGVVLTLDVGGHGIRAAKHLISLVDEVATGRGMTRDDLLLGVLPTRVPTGTNLGRASVEFASRAGWPLLPPIPVSTRIGEAAAAWELTAAYDPHGHGVEAYRTVVDQLAQKGVPA